MKRTNVEIDPEKLAIAMDLSGSKTINETVDWALDEFIRHQRRMDMLDLQGQGKWVGDLAKMRTV